MASRLYLCIIAIALALASLISLALRFGAGLSWPAAAAAGVAGVLLGHALVLAAEFILVRKINNTRPVPSRYPIVGRPNLLLAWLVEVPSAWIVFLWAIPFLGHRPLPTGTDNTRTPIVLVHGFTCNRAVWRPMAHWLANKGYPIAAPNLEPLHGSIDLYSRQIHECITELTTRTGASTVTLIGHSMGGVAIRAYLREYGDGAVSQVITVGSPHQGTALARALNSTLAKQLRLDSPWLRSLGASENDARGRLFSLIVGTEDNIVTPASIQTLPACRVVFFAGLGHLDLIRQRIVWETIDELLEQGESTTVSDVSA
jgi:pimeloyl-ACP methyl ester carboxylesterase